VIHPSTAAAEALSADAEYLKLAASSMQVPLEQLLAYASAPAGVPIAHRAVIENFLRIDPECTLAEMLADVHRFNAAASLLQEQLLKQNVS
jgi:hypothetical protein